MSKKFEKAVKEIGIKSATRHIFICCDPTKPKCCDRGDGVASWKYLKDRLKEIAKSGGPVIMRSKADCLRVCKKGPIAVVYPEGTWYHSCTPDVLEEIIQHHLLGGKVYTPNVIVEAPLNPSPVESDSPDSNDSY